METLEHNILVLEELESKMEQKKQERIFFELINRLSDKEAYQALHFNQFQEITE